MRRQMLINAVLLLLALGTLGVVWATREAPTTQELASRKGKLLASFRKEALTRIRLTQAGQTLELARDGDAAEFRIVAPWTERADVATVNQLLGALELASVLRPADGVSPEQAGLDARALQIELKTPKETQIVRLGGPAPAPAGARYAAVQEGATQHTYVVSQGVGSELSLPFDKFRETRLLEYGRSELRKIELQSPDQRLALEQHEHGAFFFDHAGASELANRDAVERVLTALSRLSTEQFVEPDAARAAVGSDSQKVQLELVDKSVPPIALTFGKSCPKAPELALLLREQPGKAPRAGCVASDIAAALRVTPDELKLTAAFSARSDEIEELRIVRDSHKLELARKDNAFVLRTGGNSEVTLDAGNEKIAAILRAQGQPSNAAPAELGLEPSAGEMTIQVAGSSEAAHREEQVALGTPLSDGRVCLKRKLDGKVLCFSADAARAFSTDATLLKGLNLLSFAPSELSTISVDAGELHERVRRREDGSYELEAPRGYAHDGALVAEAVQTLGTLRAARWVGTTEENSFGLATPRLRVGFTLTSSKSARELVVGAPTTGGFFARLSPEPEVFVLPRAAFSDLATPLIDRSLSPLSQAELAQIELSAGGRTLVLTRKGDSWEGPSVTPSHAAELVETLSALRAESAVHLGPARANEGFSRPSVSITLTSSAGRRYRLLLGARDTLDDAAIVYARLDDVDATFALAQRTAESLQQL